MGLLSTEAEVAMVGENVKYYENLGYEIPRKLDARKRCVIPQGTKIIVKVEHLKSNSTALVNVECDHCNRKDTVSYKKYYNSTHSQIANGKYLCTKCSHMLKRGENHHCWNHTISKEERINRRYIPGYEEFVKTVLKRDKYICQCCHNELRKDIEVHHLNGYNWCVDGRTDPENGITLCEECHKNFHMTYGSGDNTKEQFEKWIGYTMQNLNDYDNKNLPTAKMVYCIEENKIYKSAYEVAESLGLAGGCPSLIYDTCNHKIIHEKYVLKDGTVKFFDKEVITVRGMHFIWYDEFLKMNEDEIKKYSERKNSYYKKIICLTSKKIFNSITEASKYYNIHSSSHITVCCKGRRQTCGQLPDGTRLRWMYYDDYLKLQDKQTA